MCNRPFPCVETDINGWRILLAKQILPRFWMSFGILSFWLFRVYGRVLTNGGIKGEPLAQMQEIWGGFAVRELINKFRGFPRIPAEVEKRKYFFRNKITTCEACIIFMYLKFSVLAFTRVIRESRCKITAKSRTHILSNNGRSERFLVICTIFSVYKLI